MPMFTLHGPRDGMIKNIAKAITFDEESDNETSEIKANGHLVPFGECSVYCHDESTPPNHEAHGRSSPIWDSGVGSPTPGSSPCRRTKAPARRLGLSPIRFTLDDDGNGKVRTIDTPKTGFSSMNESGLGTLPATPVEESFRLSKYTPSLPAYTPLRTPSLQQSLRRMRISDGLQSPKKYCRNMSKFRKLKNLTSTVKGKSVGLENGDLIQKEDDPQTNVNPFAFTTESAKRVGLKRVREEVERSLEGFSQMECIEEEDRPRKKLALRNINTSRLREEFHVLCNIGDGQFGSVYKCVNRMDGCTYAVKRSKVPVAGSAFERNALNEVYAHAVLGKHVHIVGYYSAWAEHDHMFIQNEYCNGGSLSKVLCDNRMKGKIFTELELKQLMCQLIHGLQYIHSHDLAHLDLKPDNIFISVDKSNAFMQDSFCEGLEDETLSPITYKIGDFGMVTSISNPADIEEGDSRYLPKEVLHEDYGHLQKADIFSLALTVYEAGSGLELPQNGPLWHKLRDDGLPNMSHVSVDFNSLLRLMADADPVLRPSAAEISHSHVLVPCAKRTNEELQRELEEQKLKNEQLLRQLDRLKVMFQSTSFLTSKKTRLVGRRSTRTQSSI